MDKQTVLRTVSKGDGAEERLGKAKQQFIAMAEELAVAMPKVMQRMEQVLAKMHGRAAEPPLE